MDLATSSRTHRRAAHRAGGHRRWPKRLLIGVSILVVLVLALGLGGWFYVNSVLSSIKRFPVSGLTPETPGAPIDILLIGSDSRAFVSDPGQVASFGNPLTQTGQRSDVIIVMRLVPKTHQIVMLSIPRDTYVPIPGTGGSNRINAAFNTGPTVLVKTIQQNFGIPINHVVVANFPGFQAMVNALGGIRLDFRYPVRDKYSGLNVTTLGCQTVMGTTALALVRSRHLWYYDHGWQYDGLSDLSRIQRQQAFFHAVINKAKGEFPNIFALNDLLNATAQDLQMDSGFSPGQLISLGMGFRGVGFQSTRDEGPSHLRRDDRWRRRPACGSAVRPPDDRLLPGGGNLVEFDRDSQGRHRERPTGHRQDGVRRDRDDRSAEPDLFRYAADDPGALEPQALLT